MIHLSTRLVWHDNAWDGCVCQAPHLNASCIVQEQIRDGRDDDLERAHAGIPLADLPDWLPPCSHDIAAYADRGFTFIHRDPLDRDFRLPDFTIGFAGDICYWEHLGMLSVPAYREGWQRKRRWYEERMGIPVVGDGAHPGREIEPGASPLVITSRDDERGGIDQTEIERLAHKYILLEE